jgi:hypothetical protein
MATQPVVSHKLVLLGDTSVGYVLCGGSVARLSRRGQLHALRQLPFPDSSHEFLHTRTPLAAQEELPGCTLL